VSLTPDRVINNTNELAKERNRGAAERTLTSWIQSCLGIIGFGAGFDNILTALHQAFPEQSLVFSLKLTHIIGLTTIGSGIFLLVLSMIPYQAEIRSLEREDYFERPPHLLNLGILVSSIILYGLIAFVAVLFILPWQ
jgi:putative membrane protein